MTQIRPVEAVRVREHGRRLVGLARPGADGYNLRYLDLFQEVAAGQIPERDAPSARLQPTPAPR
jgi:hypothetical protein